MLSDHQMTVYRRARYHGRQPADALDKARAHDPAAPVYWSAPFMQAGAPWSEGANRGLRWIERPQDMGLRHVGTADECSRNHGSRRIDHRGWYCRAFANGETDTDSELARGVVYRLPARKGRARFLAGILDPNGNGDAAAIDCSHVIISDGFGDDDSDAIMEAAVSADEGARIYAESECEYSAAWDAGQRWRFHADNIASERDSIRALLADRRKARANALSAGDYPALCETIRANVAAALDSISEAREAMEKLWQNVPTRLESSFLDGAELDKAPA